jgi:predicted Zn-dependent protease
VDEGGDSLVTTTVKLSADKSHLIRDFSIAQQGKEALEKTAAAKPDDPALQFLLAYHCITANQPAAAKESLTRLNKLLPTDPVVNQQARAAGVESDKN